MIVDKNGVVKYPIVTAVDIAIGLAMQDNRLNHQYFNVIRANGTVLIAPSPKAMLLMIHIQNQGTTNSSTVEAIPAHKMETIFYGRL